MLRNPADASLKRHLSLFRASDYWHEPSATMNGLAHKEWCHFCVLADNLDLLVNFSLVGNTSGVVPRPRVTVLATDRKGVWDGDVEEFLPEHSSFQYGQFDFVAGCNSVRLVEDKYEIDITLKKRPISISLVLRAVTKPVVANGIRLGDHESIRWMVVPHLLASGEVIIGEQRSEIKNAPAYHDRNWGNFSWGGAYAWEWATIIPSSATDDISLVYSRISDRNRSRTLSQSLIVWKGSAPCRKFVGRDIESVSSGNLQTKNTLRVPRIMALVMDESAADIPRSWGISANGFGARVDIDATFHSYAQIGVPNDRGIGLTTLSEVIGEAHVRAEIVGETYSFDARIQAEINCAEE